MKELAVLEEQYNVVCLTCGAVWTPAVRSPLWWRAKKYAEEGFLDALHVSGEKCGCVKKQVESNAPYRVFGYTLSCEDFDIPCQTFVDAVRQYRKLSKMLCTVFISGVSPRVERELSWL